MSQNVMITGTGRSSALGFNLVLRYLALLTKGKTIRSDYLQFFIPSSSMEI